ncbi:28S ribosomal protein S31, mitochondrial isoform X2 [Bombina bombina]|uniref:28S ribosomal protein S31, mitochondrial isoform X2 n=1 Tax=Bombina bombina TaxID=8345 RepID=UPI00235ACCF8|nr:28S ribosomal protein S31, mitochondrial isoform X2 [Bombina bombina]
MSGSRCVFGMYHRVPVWVVKGVSAVAVPGRSRCAEQVLKLFSNGNVLYCDKHKSDPDVNDATKQGGQGKGSEPPGKENLMNVIGGMKVEISSKRRFQALKMSKAKENKAEQVESMESTSSMFQKAVKQSNEESKPLDADLVAAASAVASSLPFNKKQIESELLQQLRKHEQDTDTQRKGESSISNLISDMKVGKPGARSSIWRSNQIQFDDDGRGYTHDRGVTHELAGVRRRGLYTGKRLSIFPVFSDSEQPTGTEPSPNLWDLELANQIAATNEQPPRNGFEEMIQLTKEGKLWTFPIDNEAGLEEEQKVEFHEHIFLDKYLEDFPKHGPIRHFIELVICGLSKNPYITVKQKQEHIEWFRDYFQQKEDVLKESDVYLN